MDYDFIRHRITELRLKKGLSEYQMSLDLGHLQPVVQSLALKNSYTSANTYV